MQCSGLEAELWEHGEEEDESGREGEREGEIENSRAARLAPPAAAPFANAARSGL